MGLFSPARDPEDPRQLQIAVHELGHAWAWKEGGFRILEIRHTGDAGWVDTNREQRGWDQDIAREYCLGCWGGFEAEDRWMRKFGHGRAHRGNSGHDISNFKHVARGLKPGLQESKARAIARDRVAKHWSQILRQAPVLVRDGRISI
ncbi:hypothetical protein [Amycolatopsis sp. lyj-108]|uniref:hypothetical protein n=1 Tax=Amycolatopsis sp. lyj-108 TaxID=2789286 RepID=UPI00397AE54F